MAVDVVVFFVNKSSRKNVPDVGTGTDFGVAYILSGLATDRVKAPVSDVNGIRAGYLDC